MLSAYGYPRASRAPRIAQPAGTLQPLVRRPRPPALGQGALSVPNRYRAAVPRADRLALPTLNATPSLSGPFRAPSNPSRDRVVEILHYCSRNWRILEVRDQRASHRGRAGAAPKYLLPRPFIFLPAPSSRLTAPSLVTVSPCPAAQARRAARCLLSARPSSCPCQMRRFNSLLECATCTAESAWINAEGCGTPPCRRGGSMRSAPHARHGPGEGRAGGY